MPRAYSIAGSPLDEVLEFYIALVDNGLTPSIFAQEVGATFHYLSPKGRFTITAAAKPRVVMIATGTGLAPFVAQIRTLWKAFHSGVPQHQRVLLFYGVAYADEFGYRQELETYAAARKDSRLHLHLLLFASRSRTWLDRDHRQGPGQRSRAPRLRPAHPRGPHSGAHRRASRSPRCANW